VPQYSCNSGQNTGNIGTAERCQTLPATDATIQSDEQVADVAQLVEQLIRNQQVVSSSLTVGSMILAVYR
jgi:hypothetical protein